MTCYRDKRTQVSFDRRTVRGTIKIPFFAQDFLRENEMKKGATDAVEHLPRFLGKKISMQCYILKNIRDHDFLVARHSFSGLFFQCVIQF